MSILIYIFVVLINYIMESKEILIVPITDAIIPSGVVDQPSVCGAFILNTMKMIEDLGKLTDARGVRRHYAVYECSYCGKIITTRTESVKKNPLMSCGCERLKHVAKSAFNHGLCNHPLYNVWSMVRDRCNNPNNSKYEYYGGRGIRVCDEWENEFKSFYDWAMLNGYKKGLQINRIDNDLNYCPENCEMTTRFVNNQNNTLLRSTNKSGYRGVRFRQDTKKWMALIQSEGILYRLGYYHTAKDGAQAYNNFVITHKTNHPLNNL